MGEAAAFQFSFEWIQWYSLLFANYWIRYKICRHLSSLRALPDFAKINNNGTIGKGVGQVGVRLAYGFKL
jgi:hypothetical protein